MAAALHAIQNYFAEYYERHQMTFHQNHDDDDDGDNHDPLEELDHPENDEIPSPTPTPHHERMSNLIKRVQYKLLMSLQESFCNHLQRAVQPVSDHAYHAFLHQRLANETKGSPDQVDHFDQVEDEDGDELQYDEEALLDHAALERAKITRAQVREAARTANALKKSVLDRAVALGHRQVQLWREQRGVDSEMMTTTTTTTITATTDASDAADDGLVHDLTLEVDGGPNLLMMTNMHTKMEHIQEMEESLITLIQALQQANEDLPNHMERLQETIDTVEQGMEECAHSHDMRLFPAQDVVMMGDDNNADDDVRDDVQDEEWDKYTPEMKLAFLLS